MFELKEGKIIISPDKLNLPYFHIIWQADKSKTKEVAFMELGYIFYLCDNKSPYNSYPEDKRKELILADIIKNPKWKPSKQVEEAIVKYKELSETPSTKLLDSAKGVIEKLTKHFNNVDFDKVKLDAQGNKIPYYDAKDVMTTLGNIGKVVEGLSALEERVKKESMSHNKRRGGTESAIFENDDL